MLGRAPPRHGRLIGTNQEENLLALMRRIGLVQRRERTAGSWIIEENDWPRETAGRSGVPPTKWPRRNAS